LAGWASSLGEPAAPAIVAGIPVAIEIPRGASAREIGDLLAQSGVVSSRRGFEAALRSADAAEALKAGSYQLETGMDPETVVQILLAGPVVEAYSITVLEGLRLSELLETIASQSPFGTEELERVLRSGAVRSSLLAPAAVDELTRWEGMLFPDTYRVAEGAAAVQVLQMLAATMEERYEEIDWSNPRVAAFSPYERVIVASIIEAETRVDDDRALVATVIYNRLEAGMRLQVDATVLYGLGVRGRYPTAEDLQIESPYNTYLYAGLPPTPIGAPGAASLAAAAHPAEGDYLYYVLTGADGSHSFTSDYEEFRRWVREAKEKGRF
jgi:UPF0755 protein